MSLFNLGLILVVVGYLAALGSEANRVNPHEVGFLRLRALLGGVFRAKRADYTARGWALIVFQRIILVVLSLLMFYLFLHS